MQLWHGGASQRSRSDDRVSRPRLYALSVLTTGFCAAPEQACRPVEDCTAWLNHPATARVLACALQISPFAYQAAGEQPLGCNGPSDRPSPLGPCGPPTHGALLPAMVLELDVPYEGKELAARLHRDYMILSSIPSIVTMFTMDGWVLLARDLLEYATPTVFRPRVWPAVTARTGASGRAGHAPARKPPTFVPVHQAHSGCIRASMRLEGIGAPPLSLAPLKPSAGTFDSPPASRTCRHVLHQNRSSIAYMGYLVGLAGSPGDQSAATAAEQGGSSSTRPGAAAWVERRPASDRGGRGEPAGGVGSSAVGPVPPSPRGRTNWLQQLFTLEPDKLEAMMRDVAEGRVRGGWCGLRLC